VFRRDQATGSPRLHTGDYGHLDGDGYLYFAGRKDAVFKRRGTRMSTIEIEAAAMDVPGVRAAAVLCPTTDRDLTLCVDSDLAPQVVLRESAARLEPAKVPATCHRVTDFPLTPHGKNATAELALLVDRMGT
jgi:acyl-coenzyme A synthetase/AMP-(fatty) acid ligase